MQPIRRRRAGSARPSLSPTSVGPPLNTPESIVQTVAWDQRFGRRFFFKAAYLHRNGSHAYVLYPDADAGTLTLSSSGESRYWELETTGRWLANEHRDITVSYVRSQSTRGPERLRPVLRHFRNPIIRPNENSLSPTDVPNRLIVRGAHWAAGGQWVFSPLYEWRTGFPWSAVNEFQDFVGHAERSGRLPTVSTLDFTLVAAVALQEVPLHRRASRSTTRFDTGNERDVQANIASPDYGNFYNPIQRSIGFLVSTSRP